MSDTVAKRTPIVGAMVEAAAKGRALMGGSSAMRAAGETYLPKFKAEDPLDYQARLKASWLFNGFKKTVNDMTGRVFDKPVEIAEGSARLVGWMQNADMQGRDLSAFAKEVFKDGFGSGVSFIMVDAPKREGDVTQDEAERRNLRPYLSHLRVEDVLGWKTEVYDNVTALSQFRIMESVEVKDPDDEFASDIVEQVRVLDRTETGVNVRIYRQSRDEKWVLFDEYPTPATEITVIPYYAARTGFFQGEPVLDDLADVNIAHWQSQSDQRNILHFARVPILHATGRDDSESLVVSAGTATQSINPQAKLEWVEHGGQAIGAGRQDLKDLEFQMEAMGLQLLVSSAETATGEARQAAKETSQLAMMADNLKDALEQAMIWALEYAGEQTEVSLTVNNEFGVSMLTPQEAQVMLTAVNTGNMSRETFLEEMKRRGMIRDDLDTQEEADRIEAEGGELMAAQGEA